MRLLFISCNQGFQQTLNTGIHRGFKTLAAERGPGFAYRPFFYDQRPNTGLMKVIEPFQPSVVLVLRGMRMPSTVIRALDGLGIETGVWLIDDPYRLQTHEQLVEPYSFVITQESSCVSFYQQLGKPCFHLPLAADPYQFQPQPVTSRYRSDICFVGSAFPSRIETFNRLASFLEPLSFRIIGQWWQRLERYDALKQGIINQPIPADEAARYYNGARIVLNIHRTRNDRRDNHWNLPAHTPNNRTFNVASCQAFQLTTARHDLEQLYRIDDEMITFSSVRELTELIEYYLERPERRRMIASRAYRRTLAEHTYAVRLQEMVRLLTKHLA